MKKNEAINEISVQYKRPKIESMVQILKAEEMYQHLMKQIDLERIDLKEFFWVVLLTQSNHVLGISKISEGSTVGTIVGTKEIFQLVLKANAQAIILCHNHPSGNTKPSNADIQSTRQIKEFANMLGVSLLDHLIITSESYFSFADEDLI